MLSADTSGAWQECEESNPLVTALETAAVPYDFNLQTYGTSGRIRTCIFTVNSGESYQLRRYWYGANLGIRTLYLNLTKIALIRMSLKGRSESTRTLAGLSTVLTVSRMVARSGIKPD
jgi:hypothetical protein